MIIGMFIMWVDWVKDFISEGLQGYKNHHYETVFSP
jgi:hypothetical protein